MESIFSQILRKESKTSERERQFGRDSGEDRQDSSGVSVSSSVGKWIGGIRTPFREDAEEQHQDNPWRFGEHRDVSV
jgi:hypothetical protein